MKETIVEWLIEELEKFHGEDFGCPMELYKQAKAMEKDQAQKYAEFCVECDRKEMPLLDFKSWIEL